MSLVSNKGFSHNILAINGDGYMGASGDIITTGAGAVVGGSINWLFPSTFGDESIKVKLYGVEYDMPANSAGLFFTVELLSKIVDYTEFIKTLRRYKTNIVTCDNKTLFENGIPVPGEWREDINQYIQNMLQMEEALE